MKTLKNEILERDITPKNIKEKIIHIGELIENKLYYLGDINLDTEKFLETLIRIDDNLNKLIGPIEIENNKLSLGKTLLGPDFEIDLDVHNINTYKIDTIIGELNKLKINYVIDNDKITLTDSDNVTTSVKLESTILKCLKSVIVKYINEKYEHKSKK